MTFGDELREISDEYERQQLEETKKKFSSNMTTYMDEMKKQAKRGFRSYKKTDIITKENYILFIAFLRDWAEENNIHITYSEDIYCSKQSIMMDGRNLPCVYVDLEFSW